MANKSNQKIFKQTKQLVRIAINDGWTQTRIAKQCRTQQSIVSAWQNGEKLATIQSLTPLLKLYGTELRRNSSRVYCCINEEEKYCYYRVEGKIIFSSICYALIENQRRLERDAALKIIVHYQGDGIFRLIYQQKRIILPQSQTHRKPPPKYTFDDDDASWISQISNPLPISKLLDHVCKIAVSLESSHANEAATLSFLIRKALLNHGFTVEDVVDLPATW